jgi:hypothetical protein
MHSARAITLYTTTGAGRFVRRTLVVHVFESTGPMIERGNVLVVTPRLMKCVIRHPEGVPQQYARPEASSHVSYRETQISLSELH